MNEIPSFSLQELQEKANDLPRRPGCYLMRNSRDEVIYIGKAKDLKSRVLSYFNNSAKGPKTEILVGHIKKFDFFLTETETEALILENNLIKKYLPKYNIRLRDDKSYPYIVLNWNEPFPRLQYARKVKRGKHIEIYGPFVIGSNISEVLRVLVKTFQLRDCTLQEFKKRKEPCLLYQMKQCSAPCVDKINQKTYENDLSMALSFFNGKGTIGLKFLRKKMEKYAEEEQFELAASTRDNLLLLEDFLQSSQQKNAEMYGGQSDIDIWSFYMGDLEIDLGLYIVRNSTLIGSKNFHFAKIECQEIDEESLCQQVQQFILQYYSQTKDSLPQLILAPLSELMISDMDLAIKEITKKNEIEIKGPIKKFDSLMKLSFEFAKEQQRIRLSSDFNISKALKELGLLLQLKEYPKTIECYDVAIWQGQSPTASQVVFWEGRPDKKAYRYYHLKNRPEGNNDFAMMKEVLQRRLDNGPLPDLFVVDGGKGQLNIFLEVLKDGKIDIPVLALAKAKTESNVFSHKISKSEERIFIAGRSNPIELKKHKGIMKILVEMRDEAHRFSRKLHHQAEKKRILGNS